MKPPTFGVPAPPNAYESGLQDVNGIQISVAWDKMYGDYTLFLPQLKPDWARGVNDQVIRLSKLAREAHKAFEYACRLAEQGKDVEDIYFAVGRLQADFLYDEEVVEDNSYHYSLRSMGVSEREDDNEEEEDDWDDMF